MDVDDLIKLGFYPVDKSMWLMELRHASIPDVSIRCPHPGTWTWDLDSYSHDGEYTSPLDAFIDMMGYLARFCVHIQDISIIDFPEVNR